MYHIETFHFFIKGQNNLSKADTIKSICYIKNKIIIEILFKI